MFDWLDGIQTASIARFGNGKHGEIENGNLTRDVDGGVEPWPSSSFLLWEGDNFYQRLPSRLQHQAPTDQDLLDAEANAGLDFTDDLIVTGGTQIYGKSILSGQWIFCGPSNTRWLIDPGVPSVLSNNQISSTWLADRFGEFGVEAEQVSGSLSLTTPDYDATSYTKLRDINEDGSKAIYAVYKEASFIMPSGFLLVEITEVNGIPDVSISVLKSKAETVGTCSYDNTYDMVDYEEVAAYDQSDPPPAPDPPCSGSFQRSITPNFSLQIADPINTAVYQVGTRTETYSYTGIIVGMFFVGGTPTPVTLSISGSYEQTSNMPTIDQSGGETATFEWVELDGNCVESYVSTDSDTTLVIYEQVVTATSTYSITLSGPAGEATTTYTQTGTIHNRHVRVTPDAPNGLTTEQSLDQSWSAPLSTGSYTEGYHDVPWGNFSYSPIGSNILPQCQDPAPLTTFSVLGPVYMETFRVKPLSNTLFAIEVNATVSDDSHYDNFYYRSGLTGAATSPTTVAWKNSSAGAKIYASYNPRDGRVAESQFPVNWV